MEWPKTIHLDETETISNPITMEADMAPLIHRARNVIKCRTSHPTMRVKVCAIGDSQANTIASVFFRATLVKMANDSNELRPVAGKLILTQREGTPSVKNHEQHGISVTNDGRLVVSQRSTSHEAEDETLKQCSQQFGEASRTIAIQFHDGLLSSTFPEMGVMLNSMIDRRQLNTRYAIQVEVELKLKNGSVIEHTLLSHPFLIAITNDQTEPLLLSIFWQRLLNDQQIDYSMNQEAEEMTAVKWGILKQTIKYFMKAQIPNARSLNDSEVLHVQCMLFLPRALHENPAVIEEQLFGNVDNLELGVLGLRNRLLSEFVNDDVVVQKQEFMRNKCISIIDCHTSLEHSVWHWLFKATEMVIDVGHKLCPAPIYNEKKGIKAKRPSTSATHSEVCTMLNLFNRRILTLVGVQQATAWFQALSAQESSPRVLLLRFCDENLGSISFVASNPESSGLPFNGSLSSEKIRDLKQGLPEALMDETFPKQYDKLLQLDKENNSIPVFHIVKKTHIFSQYQTLRLRNEAKNIENPFGIRIDPLTGERFDRFEEPPTGASSVDTVLLGSQPAVIPMDLTNNTGETSSLPNQDELVLSGQIPNSFMNLPIPSNNLDAAFMQNLVTMFQNQTDGLLLANNMPMLQDNVQASKTLNDMIMLGILSNHLTENTSLDPVNEKSNNRGKSKRNRR
uniref:Uncharacterized protein n=1 Tax=Acrobeloides nanus TaxID=290746 RepID=A0A914BZY9_9BILA